MKNKKAKILYGIIGILGAAVAIVPLSVYYFIETAGMHNMAMGCYTACIAATVVGVIIAAAAVVSLFFNNTKAKVAVPALLFAAGIAACAVPRTFRLCGSAEMACRYITKPTLTFFGSAIIILSLVLLAAQVISIRKESAAA